MGSTVITAILLEDETQPRGCKYPTPPCALPKILPETTVPALENASPTAGTFLTFSRNLLYPCMYTRGESLGAYSGFGLWAKTPRGGNEAESLLGGPFGKKNGSPSKTISVHSLFLRRAPNKYPQSTITIIITTIQYLFLIYTINLQSSSNTCDRSR